jgi:hypothetical protein
MLSQIRKMNVVRDPLKQLRPLKILSLPGSVGPTKPESPGGTLTTLYLAGGNPGGVTPNQVVAVLATLAAVTHGEGGSRLDIQESILLCPWWNKIIQMSDCTEFQGKEVYLCSII